MPDLQDVIRLWFNDTPHNKSWLLDHTQFVAKGPHSQKGYILLIHDGIEYLRLHQYGSGRGIIKAADPRFFDKLDRILKELLL